MSECKINIYNNNLSDENVIIALFDGKRESRFRYFKDYKVYSIPANGWRIFGMIDAYVEVISKLIKTFKNPKKILFIGICKHSNMILECAGRIVNEFPEISFGVLGAPWCYDCDKSESPSCNGIYLSEEVNTIYKENKTELIEKLKFYGCASNIFYRYKDLFLSGKLKLFQYFSYNDDWTLDLVNKDRCEYLTETMNVKVPNDWKHDKVHASIVFLVKNEDVINYIKKCFNHL